MTGMQSVFSSSNPSSSHPGVTLANGTSVPVHGSGSVNIPSIFSLPSVLHVPNFPFNLMSISKLTKQLNCSVTFFSGSVVIQDLKTQKMIGKGHKAHGLYYLSPIPTLTCTSIPSSIDIHCRLGHPSLANLKMLVPHLSVRPTSRVNTIVPPFFLALLNELVLPLN